MLDRVLGILLCTTLTSWVLWENEFTLLFFWLCKIQEIKHLHLLCLKLWILVCAFDSFELRICFNCVIVTFFKAKFVYIWEQNKRKRMIATSTGSSLQGYFLGTSRKVEGAIYNNAALYFEYLFWFRLVPDYLFIFRFSFSFWN